MKEKPTIKVYKVTFRGFELVTIHEYGIVLAGNIGECLQKARRHEKFPEKNWEITGIELVSDSFI